MILFYASMNNLLRSRWDWQVIYPSFIFTTQTADNFIPSEVLLLEVKSSDHPSLVKQCPKELWGARCEDSEVAKLLEEKKLVGYTSSCRSVTCTCGWIKVSLQKTHSFQTLKCSSWF